MTMTAFQREGLQLLGYTKRESEFLFLVATHSGYFTIRQFKRFLGTESGSVSHTFIRKLVDQKHASYHAFRSGARVYHLFARKVYQAIEREHLRTRKKHELDYVKTRLVALDFVLSHPQCHYLETEAEKIAFFERDWKIPREAFPVKHYRARKSAEVTPRYFVDRFPMFVDRLSSPPVVTFTYVDAGAVTLDGFVTHLSAYFGLFRKLPAIEFIYVAPTERLFQAAQSAFHRVLSPECDRSKPTGILDYFRIRKAWEAKERVASADVVLLKEAQARYAGRSFEQLYEKWHQGGVADAQVAHIADKSRQSGTYIFRTTICGSTLSIFADPRWIGAENRTENDHADQSLQKSSAQSVQLSNP
jgi:hypothetical protein